MGGTVMVDGTTRKVNPGKVLINGTAHNIKQGKTMIGGTIYSINFAKYPIGYRWEFYKKLATPGDPMSDDVIYQTFDAEVSGRYKFYVAGGSGATLGGYSLPYGGSGGGITAYKDLNKGDHCRIMVGKAGLASYYSNPTNIDYATGHRSFICSSNVSLGYAHPYPDYTFDWYVMAGGGTRETGRAGVSYKAVDSPTQTNTGDPKICGCYDSFGDYYTLMSSVIGGPQLDPGAHDGIVVVELVSYR